MFCIAIFFTSVLSFSFEGDNFKISYAFPRRINKNGEFLSNDLNHLHKRADYHTLHYEVPLDNDIRQLVLQPTDNLVAKDAIVEIRSNYNTNSVKPLENINMQLLNNRSCSYTGTIKNETYSKLAINTCDGLNGLIITKQRTHLIQPAATQENQSLGCKHEIYSFDRPNAIPNCMTKTVKQTRSNSESQIISISKNQLEQNVFKHINYSLNLKMLLVLDKSFIINHKTTDVENYVLTIFNMAHNLFLDASLGHNLNLELVRIIRLEEDSNTINLENERRGFKLLNEFAKLQEQWNPQEESHPYHHDVAALLTKRTICNDYNCNVLGVAEEGGACSGSQQAVICKDTGLQLGYVLAHEIAHTLGISHDGDGSACNADLPSGFATIMNPAITSQAEEWSACSRSNLQEFLRNGYGDCLTNEPSKHSVSTIDILPGVMYGPDYQCQQLLTPEAQECENRSTCSSLHCKYPDTNCMVTGVPPAFGTACSENKWCYMGKCVEVGDRPSAINGDWGPWSQWSTCSRSCGSGVSESTRECNSPLPQHGGKYCSGHRIKHKICSIQPCPSNSIPFRDAQCASYNHWIFPEDVRNHSWVASFDHNKDPCSLVCKNEENVVISLGDVIDGSLCYQGIRDICIGGNCKTIPCDLQFESNAVEDACGVCHGNGTSCHLVQGTKEFNNKGLELVVKVPKKSKNIIVEEDLPSKSRLIIRSQETNEILNKRVKLGMFNISGSIGWIGMKKLDQELLNIPGPIEENLLIMMRVLEPVSVSYSFGAPEVRQRQGRYTWDYLDWSRCSRQCGPGIEYAEGKCIEMEGGLVEDRFCQNVEKLPIKTRICDLGPCKQSWYAGDWQECGPCPSSQARRFRLVNCIQPSGEDENESIILSDTLCDDNKPASIEKCNCREKKFAENNKTNIISSLRNILSNNERSSFLDKLTNAVSTSSTPVTKVTLMQVETENEKSMMKQLKENEVKAKPFPLLNIHHIYLPKPKYPNNNFKREISYNKFYVPYQLLNISNLYKNGLWNYPVGKLINSNHYGLTKKENFNPNRNRFNQIATIRPNQYIEKLVETNIILRKMLNAALKTILSNKDNALNNLDHLQNGDFYDIAINQLINNIISQSNLLNFPLNNFVNKRYSFMNGKAIPTSYNSNKESLKSLINKVAKSEPSIFVTAYKGQREEKKVNSYENLQVPFLQPPSIKQEPSASLRQTHSANVSTDKKIVENKFQSELDHIERLLLAVVQNYLQNKMVDDKEFFKRAMRSVKKDMNIALLKYRNLFQFDKGLEMWQNSFRKEDEEIESFMNNTK